MLLTVREFVSLATRRMPDLVSRLQETTGRFGDEEKRAWSSSLQCAAGVFEHSDLDGFHVQVGRASGNLSLEYRLPAASSWCDLVLLGRGAEKPAAVMMELKHWDVSRDRPGPRPGIILHNNAETLHPSEQVRGYVEYCRRFHSAAQESGAEVFGCTLLTAARGAEAYTASPHDTLTRDYPVFTASTADASQRLPRYLRSHLRKPDSDFAEEFEEGTYRQDRSFVRSIAEALLDPANAGFVLLDAQRLGFERCLQAVGECLAARPACKTVIIVEGPPGSGKSVLAARLWAELARDDRLKGNIVFATTSGSQRSNWEAIYEGVADSPAARGVVIGANRFNPGLSPMWVKDQRAKGLKVTIQDWRANLSLYKRLGNRPRLSDNDIEVAVVDEAHALIDPTAPGAEGVAPSGWCHHAGPQAWHVIRASRVSIFFLDPEQSYRDNETTTAARIVASAKDQGAKVLPTISLGDAQFRCAGSKEYVEWAEALLSGGSARSTSWRDRQGSRGFTFEIVDDPAALEERLREQIRQGRTARLLAAYGRKWKTKLLAHPHDIAPDEMDFSIRYRGGNQTRTWSRIWNYAPKMNYTLFVQAPIGSRMREDPLSEVGCPYVVRGFDFDYVGLLWLSDLVWRKDRWLAQIEHIHESAWKKTLAAAKKEAKLGGEGQASENLLRQLTRGYRILLTRPIRGIYVWCEDSETRDHLAEALGDVGNA